MRIRIDPHITRYLLDVADALNGDLRLREVYANDVYITEVRFAFGGEDLTSRLVADDHGHLTLEIEASEWELS